MPFAHGSSGVSGGLFRRTLAMSFDGGSMVLGGAVVVLSRLYMGVLYVVLWSIRLFVLGFAACRVGAFFRHEPAPPRVKPVSKAFALFS
jgi:hypothetical protein